MVTMHQTVLAPSRATSAVAALFTAGSPPTEVPSTGWHVQSDWVGVPLASPHGAPQRPPRRNSITPACKPTLLPPQQRHEAPHPKRAMQTPSRIAVAPVTESASGSGGASQTRISDDLPDLIRKPIVLHLTQLSNTTLHDLRSQGEFPPPVRIGARAVAWRLREVLRWIEARPVAVGKQSKGVE